MEVRVEHPHFSAPFAAGVAALVWAANPGLTGDDVERILLETAHTSPDATAGRYVNALAAVLAAANLPPELTVHRPDGGAQVPLNVPVTFVHRARTVHRGGDRPGQRRGDRSRKASRRGGEHPARGRDHQAGTASVRVSLRVTDAAGRSATDSVVLHTQPCPIVG